MTEAPHHNEPTSTAKEGLPLTGTGARPADSAGLMKLAFMVFIQIADSRSKVSVREAEAFGKLIDDPEWCTSDSLQRAFRASGSRYAELWKQYATGHLQINAEITKAYFAKLTDSLSTSEKASLNNDLLHLAKAVAGTAGLVGGLIPGKKEKRHLVKAFDELLESMAHGPVASSGPAQAAETNAAHPVAEVQSAADASDELVPFKLSELMPMARMTSENVRPWSRGTIDVCCIQTIQETHDVMTFRFAGIVPVLFYFKPGQFITLEVEIDGRTVKRSYTISSSPSRPHLVAVTIKRVPGGLVSNWLHDNLRVGDTLRLNGPNGRFNCFDIPSKKVLFLSGGSGITPVMSMARWLYDTGADCDMIFVHSARSPKDIIFRRELELMDAQMPSFKLAVSCTRSESGEPWSGCTGRLNQRMLEVIAPDYQERAIYLCGPVPLMKMIKDLLTEVQFPMERFFQESFGGVKKTRAKGASALAPDRVSSDSAHSESVLPAATKDQATAAPQPTVSSKLVFAQSGTETECSEDDSILDLAEQNGVFIDYSCRAGSCGTCKVRKLEGEVESDATDGLTEQEIDEGYILTCCSYPLGRVTLDV